MSEDVKRRVPAWAARAALFFVSSAVQVVAAGPLDAARFWAVVCGSLGMLQATRWELEARRGE